MPSISAEDLRERLARDIPGAVLDNPPPAEGAPASMLHTTDTLVPAEKIVEIAVYLRDKIGYTFLSDIAAVDFLAEQVLELVYRFYHVDGGSELVLKVRLPRDEARLPSLTPEWPGAGLHEREAFDLFGVVFEGHPFLKRIYMWDEFEGYPMRKDFPKQGDKYLSE